MSSPFLLMTLTSIVIGILAVFKLQYIRQHRFPTVNAYPRDFTKKKAHAAFMANAKSLIAEGFVKFNGPFRIITALGSRVILPPSYTEWVKTCQDLDHVALVSEEFFAGFPGFEGITVVTDPSRMLIDVTKTKLSQTKESVPIMQDHIAEALGETWGDSKEWHDIDWSQDVTRFIARVSSAIFTGSELSRNPEWQDLIMTYTMNLFMATRALRSWPNFMRVFVHWFIPECIKCREQVRLARNMLSKVIKARAKARDAALAEGKIPHKYNDTIAWMEEVAAGRPFDPVAAQLAFAASALHTTSQLLNQSLLDLCVNSELIEPLRNEINAAVMDIGWTVSGLFKMECLDSVIKETQRLKPGSLVNLERRALKDVTMPNGKVLPQGTHVAVDTSEMWSPEAYENPDKYDGLRFQRMRELGKKGSNMAQLVSPSPQHFAFGLGKPVCPGRFFAANEMKLALANILLKFDVRLKDGYEPKVIHLGFEMLSDPAPKLEVRRR